MNDMVKNLAEGGSLAVNSGAKKEEFVIISTDEKVAIYRCKVGNAPDVLELISEILQILNIHNITKAKESISSNDTLKDPAVILKLITHNLPMCLKICASLTSLSTVEKVNSLEIDDFLTVAIKVIEVNKEFFLGRVMEVLPLE